MTGYDGTEKQHQLQDLDLGVALSDLIRNGIQLGKYMLHRGIGPGDVIVFITAEFFFDGLRLHRNILEKTGEAFWRVVDMDADGDPVIMPQRKVQGG